MNFTDKVNASMKEVQKVAAMFYREEITDDILLYGIYRDRQHDPIGKLMYASSMSIFMLRRTLDNEYDMGDKSYGHLEEEQVIPFSEETNYLLKDAESYAKLTNHEEVDLSHILLAILNSSNSVVKSYLEEEVDVQTLQKDLIELIYMGESKRVSSKTSCTKECAEKATPKIIKNSCEDLTQQAINGEIDPIIGRHKEVDMIINTLSRRTKNNVLIVGPAGSGKLI